MNKDFNDEFDDEFDNEFNEDFLDKHPLDTFFNSNTITFQYKEDEEEQQVACDLYDEKDNSLDKELSDLAKLAQKTFEEQKKTAMRVEPKFRAELLGVANNLLAITLQAISKKADIKAKKDANLARSKRQTLQIGNSENTNIIVADRNELLKARKVKKED
ncbi:MAG: hypothetical protein KDH96_01120 [Candidatus Riesia sp.]|nr:hypothetical protein [Candidatus Riesia sp.]